MQKYLKWGYLIVICTFLPLYMKDGYYKLGEAKGLAFICISLVFALLFFVTGIKDLKNLFKVRDIFDYAVLVFLFSNVITFIFSKDKATGFLGLSGWRCGFLSIFLMTVLLIFLKEEKEDLYNGYILTALFVTPALEALLGILQRFGIDVINIYGKDISFLATIGNINWYVGFLSVFVPLGVGISFFLKPFSKDFFVSAVYTFLGLLALMVQGSDSAVIVVAATYLLLLFFGFDTRDNMKRFLYQLFILGVAMAAADVLMALFAESYTYEKNILLELCCDHIGIILMALSFFLYRLIRFFEEINVKWRGGILREIFGFFFIAALSAGLFFFIRDFDLTFGNGRGVIWSISFDMFKDLSPWQKAVGVGQDYFCGYAYSRVDISDALLNTYPGYIVTNAHCEPLTILIERGILGLISYLLLVVSPIIFLFQKNRKDADIICALPVFAYFMNGLVSFSTPVSTPYLFMILGVSSYIRKRNIS